MVANTARTHVQAQNQQKPHSYVSVAATPAQLQELKTPQKGGRKRSATVGPTPPQNPKKKQTKNSKQANQVQSSNTKEFCTHKVKKSRVLSMARRRIFTNRMDPYLL